MRLATLLAASLLLASCDSQDGPPRRAVLTAVQIDDAPLLDVNRDRWDGAGGGGPEIYFRLFYADEDFIRDPGRDLLNPRDDRFVANAFDPETPWYDDVAPTDFPLIWDVQGGFELRDLDEPFRLVLFDYDPTTQDDPMISTRVFTFAEAAPDRTDGRDDTVVLEGEGADRDRILVRLRVRYER